MRLEYCIDLILLISKSLAAKTLSPVATSVEEEVSRRTNWPPQPVNALFQVQQNPFTVGVCAAKRCYTQMTYFEALSLRAPHAINYALLRPYSLQARSRHARNSRVSNSNNH